MLALNNEAELPTIHSSVAELSNFYHVYHCYHSKTEVSLHHEDCIELKPIVATLYDCDTIVWKAVITVAVFK